MRKANSPWKIAVAVFSLLLTIFIWTKGLEDSFDRPSVTPALSLKQQEIVYLAGPAVPDSLKTLLIGNSPRISLKEMLAQIPKERLTDRQILMLTGLETSKDIQKRLLQNVSDKNNYEDLKNLFLNESQGVLVSKDLRNNLSIPNDPVLSKILCESFIGDNKQCIDMDVARNVTIRLFLSQILPIVFIILGIGLLIQKLWLTYRKSNKPIPELIPIPLSLVDMIILIAGGFVILGEVLFPALLIPLSELVTGGLESSLKIASRVFIGYLAMTIPTLFILYQQISGLSTKEKPIGGWLQMKIKPFLSNLSQAFSSWLMVMPIVLLTSWLINKVLGDQGGSNPLLEMVLNNQNNFALVLLLVTTVIFAPLFEEVIFRGTLLPSLSGSIGKSLSVLVSAIVFALAHLSVGEFLPLSVLGLALGMLRLSSGSLFPCVVMHSLWNGVTFANLLLLAI